MIWGKLLEAGEHAQLLKMLKLINLHCSNRGDSKKPKMSAPSGGIG